MTSPLPWNSRFASPVMMHGVIIYVVSRKMNMGLGFLIIAPKSFTVTPMPLTSVRNAKSGVTNGLPSMKNLAATRPRITPVGVSSGIMRSSHLLAVMRFCSTAEKRNIVSV